MEQKIKWPGGNDFAFTVVDDTDHGTVSNLSPVYDLLEDLGFRTTKTVWCYPPRDGYTGQCLEDSDHLEFVKGLQEKGFEIALHNVGSGDFSRQEIQKGLQFYKDRLGAYPKIHINHGANPDNIYWGSERFVPPFSWIYKMINGNRGKGYGEDPNSRYFWGDLHKEHIRYTRNLVFNGIDTVKADPRMPYRESSKEAYSNYWFSSSDGHTRDEFVDLIDPANVDQLEMEGGGCIVYTHFASGFLDEEGNLDPVFKERMAYLASKNGWFVPAGELLDHLLKRKTRDEFPPHPYLLSLGLRWGLDRIRKKIQRGR